jgi:hypothetical protein
MDDIQFRSLDIDRININEYYEVEYWSKQFSLQPDTFKQIIKESGITSAKELRVYLNKLYKVSAA